MIGRSPCSYLSNKIINCDENDAGDVGDDDDEDDEPALTGRQPVLAGQLSGEGRLKRPEEVLPDYDHCHHNCHHDHNIVIILS